MLGGNKRGQTDSVAKVIGAIFGIFILAVIILTMFNLDQGVGTAIETAFSEVSGFAEKIIYPFLGFILNLEKGGENAFLMVLTFILISIVVVGTLDSINIFGEERQGWLINLAIGIIVSIIGVRFMPNDMWGALTAPSSAFVATLLIGAPFLALFFVTMKIKLSFARKLLWLFYLIFMSYLIFFPESGAISNDFKWIYSIFLILALVMMFLDVRIRRFLHLEFIGKKTVAEIKGSHALRRIGQLSKEIKEMQVERDAMTDKNLRKKMTDKISKKNRELKLVSGDVE